MKMLIECGECKAQISDQAAACPQCGAPVKKVATPKKEKTGCFTWIVLIIILFMIISLFTPNEPTSSTTSAPPPPPPPKLSDMMRLDKFDWSKGGFDTVMLINAQVVNQNKVSVKDFTIECRASSLSGTVLGRPSKVVYRSIPAGGRINLHQFSMGFVHSQAERASCEVVDAKVTH